MQCLRALCLALLACAAPLAGARADTQIFLIDNSSGAGLDSCIASGAPCGEAVAMAWCRAHAYERAIDFGRVSNDAFTPISSGALSSRAAPNAACTGALCPPVVAITCTR